MDTANKSRYDDSGLARKNLSYCKHDARNGVSGITIQGHKMSRVGSLFKRMFDIQGWADWERNRGHFTYLQTTIKKFFIPRQAQAEETFEEATKRLKLDEAQLEIKKRALLRLTILMLVTAFFVLIYLIYQLIYGSFLGVLASISLMLIALALAFRYHFWYFQIKERKLGCRVLDWMRFAFIRPK